LQTAYRTNLKDAYYYPDSAWRVGFIGSYKFQVEAGVLDPSSYDRFFHATGVTPAREEKMVGLGSSVSTSKTKSWAV
jgi:hypothetical protein